MGVSVRFGAPQPATVQCFQVCAEAEEDSGVDPQQELLSKLIVFCIQDDGEPRQKGVGFHPPLQPLGSHVRRKVAQSTARLWGTLSRGARTTVCPLRLKVGGTSRPPMEVLAQAAQLKLQPP